MKQDSQDELDNLLNRVPLPKAPAWFEARLMARMRREESTPEGVWVWLQRRAVVWSTCGVAAVVLGVAGVALFSGDRVSAPLTPVQIVASETNADTQAVMSQVGGILPHKKSSKEDKVLAALDAFVSYQEDSSLWSDVQ